MVFTMESIATEFYYMEVLQMILLYESITNKSYNRENTANHLTTVNHCKLFYDTESLKVIIQ